MGKISNLDLCIGELKKAASAINEIADSLTAMFNGETDTPAEAPKLKAKKPKAITLESVRAVLAEKSRAGHTTEIRELLEKHGVAKLSDIDPAEYPALLTEVEKLDSNEVQDDG